MKGEISHQLGLTVKSKTRLAPLPTPFSIYSNDELMLINRENERKKEKELINQRNLTMKRIPVTDKVPDFRPSRKGVIKQLLGPINENSEVPKQVLAVKPRLFKLTEANLDAFSRHEIPPEGFSQTVKVIENSEDQGIDKLKIKNKLAYIGQQQLKESIKDYITNIRTMRYSDLTIQHKKEEMLKMEEFIKNKKEKLEDNMSKFESDQKLFQDYVAMIKKKEEKIFLKSEKITAESKNVQQKISNVQNDISNIKSTIEKKLDILKKLKTYQLFIFKLINNETKVEEFKQERINKLKERKAQNIDIIINHILSSSDISENDNEISSSKTSIKNNPFKEIHELGLSEQDSDDDYPIFFNDPSEVTNIINLLEEQNIAEINLLQDNKSIYDQSLKNLEEIKKHLEEKRHEVKHNLDETNQKINVKNHDYKSLEGIIQTNTSAK